MSTVSVLMPVYNEEKHISEAIDSILNQSYTAFEFIIINDGSTDRTDEIVRSYQDKRIRYISHAQNSGIVDTLNEGLSTLKGEYILRMDGDDIAHPDRISEQVAFMDAHPKIGVASSYIELFGTETGIWRPPLTDDHIKASLLFESSIMHAAAIIRKSVLQDHDLLYRADHPHMEDYDLWRRMSSYTDFANIDHVLYKYRRGANCITINNAPSLIERKKKFYSTVLSVLGIAPSERELFMHIGFESNKLPLSPSNITQYYKYLNTIVEANLSNNVYPHKALENCIAKKWRNLFHLIPTTNVLGILTYWKVAGKIQSTQVNSIVKGLLFNKEQSSRYIEQ